MKEAIVRGIRFAVGGSVAMASYSGLLRVCKDLDLYVPPDQAGAMKALLDDLGFEDYYDQKAYDRGWIYRSIKGDCIVDVIWQMANRRAVVDEYWVNAGPEIECAGERLRLIPIEEMIWSKLYVLQRDRCDWPDILNLIDSNAEKIDWKRMRRRIADDFPLLAAVLRAYAWLRPEIAQTLPKWLWKAAPESGAEPEV